ncbi:MAG TPA: adenylyl-sulfate kinase [Gallionella sp.]|nr:adenylyl-sulfate kinase [Gallionella sp.]
MHGKNASPVSADVVWQQSTVTRERREALNGHRGAILWITGLSGSGKSTLAQAVEAHLHRMGCRTFVLDGDNVRHGLCGDLGFSEADRTENIRRVGEVAGLFMQAGVIVLAAFISPFRADRDKVRAMVQPGEFVEIYCRCPLDVCEQRDVKGLYRKARAGQIAQFTGISSPYQAPDAPELVLDTAQSSLSECVDRVIAMLAQDGGALGLKAG